MALQKKIRCHRAAKKKKKKWYIKMVHQNTLPSNVYYYCGHQNGDPHGTATTSCPAKVP